MNSQNGGHLLAWAAVDLGDYSLVLLPNVPPGVVFAGWDTSDPALGAAVVGIHHPQGSYKRIAFAHTVASADFYSGTNFAPAALYDDLVYDLGVTETGSTGSPLFEAPSVIVGSLTYPPSPAGLLVCTGEQAGYARFSNTYSALEPYLENLPFSEVLPSTTQINFNGLNHVITGSPTQTFTLTTQSTGFVQFVLRPNLPWLSVVPESGTLTASTPVTVQVTVNPAYFPQTETYTGTLTLVANTAPLIFIDVNVAMVINMSNIVAAATPNPVPATGTSWQVTLSLNETNGAATTLTKMLINGADYTSSIQAFFGTNTIPALGVIQATLQTSGLLTPQTIYFEFYGTDTLSGATWVRQRPVTFTQ